MDDELNAMLRAPVEPPEDVWAAAVSAALDDPRHPAELAALIPDVEDAPDVVATPVKQDSELDEPADAGPDPQDATEWTIEDDFAHRVEQREATPDADDAGWAG